MDFRTWGILTFILAGPTTFIVAGRIRIEYSPNDYKQHNLHATSNSDSIAYCRDLGSGGHWLHCELPAGEQPPSAAHILFRFLALPFVLIGSAALMLVFPIVCALTIPF